MVLKWSLISMPFLPSDMATIYQTGLCPNLSKLHKSFSLLSSEWGNVRNFACWRTLAGSCRAVYVVLIFSEN